jgi:hypothetical protein
VGREYSNSPVGFEVVGISASIFMLRVFQDDWGIWLPVKGSPVAGFLIGLGKRPPRSAAVGTKATFPSLILLIVVP